MCASHPSWKAVRPCRDLAARHGVPLMPPSADLPIEPAAQCVISLTLVEQPNPRGTALRERFRLEYKQVVTTPSGKRLIVAASPRSLAGQPDYWPLPWPILLGWIAIRQFVLMVRHQPGWQVEVTSAWEPDRARVVAKTSKVDAIRRVDSEASALTRGTA
jgi:hypothetical protein